MVILKQIEPYCAVCFSGNRPNRLPGCLGEQQSGFCFATSQGHGNPDKPEMHKLIATLREQIEDAI